MTKTNRLALSSTAALIAATAFANPAPGAPVPAAGKAAKEKTAAPTIGAVSKAVPIPTNIGKSNRGSKSKYPFDELTEVGMSFPVMNKTAKQLSSIVSNQNRKDSNQQQAKDENGNPKFTTEPGAEVKDANGVVVGKQPDKQVAVMENIRTYVVADVDPKTDPDKATARVWRTK